MSDNSNSTQPVSIHEVFINLCVDEPEKAIKFYTEVFGAKELLRLTDHASASSATRLDTNGIGL